MTLSWDFLRKAIILGMLSFSFLHIPIEMFSYSFLLASHDISSVENVLPGSVHFAILQIFSVEFKSEFALIITSLVMCIQKIIFLLI